MSLGDLLTDPTVRTVVLGAALLGLGSGALGVFALLRRQSLLGDTMAHAALPGVVVGYLLAGERSLGAMLAGALVSGVLAALFALYLARATRVKSDAALGTSLSLGFAVGVVLLTVAQRQPGASHAGLDAFLFGQAAATLPSDLGVLAVVVTVALTLVAIFWKHAKLTTFDPDFAAAAGLRVGWIEAGLTGLLALAIVIGLQLVGVVLMSAMVVAPAAAARQWSRSLGVMVVIAGAIGVVSAAAGALLSATASGLATGPVVVLVASAVVGVSFVFAPRRATPQEA
ncbi:MAG: metal ABC transporter permease [Trueperaceae bacterium]